MSLQSPPMPVVSVPAAVIHQSTGVAESSMTPEQLAIVQARMPGLLSDMRRKKLKQEEKLYPSNEVLYKP